MADIWTPLAQPSSFGGSDDVMEYCDCKPQTATAALVEDDESSSEFFWIKLSRQ
jgi:hypothetical protein